MGSDVPKFSDVNNCDFIHSKHDFDSSLSGRNESGEETAQGESETDEAEEHVEKYFYGGNVKVVVVEPNENVGIPNPNILKVLAYLTQSQKTITIWPTDSFYLYI